MARRNPKPTPKPTPNPTPNPTIRTLLVIAFLVSATVAWAGREHLATLDAGFLWGPSGAACAATGPLAGVQANAAANADLATCAAAAPLAVRGGDAAASFVGSERSAARVAR